jgi:1,4-dihydroxy-2-naphthoate octaprenyltransferase
MFTMMLCVELPDAGTDLLAGKRTLVVRVGASLTWTLIGGLGASAAIIAAGVALRVRGAAGLLVLLPALVAGFELIRLTRGDPRPASLAFWGVALYAATVTGLAFSYGLAAAAR